MRKSAFAALVAVAGLMASLVAHAEQPARSWELSPFVGIMGGSARLGSSTDPLYGLRLGYNINRWWAVELAYATASDVDVQYKVGSQLVGSQDEFGRGVWTSLDVAGFAGSDTDFIDLNILLSTRPIKKRVTFYGTMGIGQSAFTGTMNQAQIDAAFARGPFPIPDTFDANGNGDTNDLVDEYTCPTCDIVFDNPNDPLINPTPDCDDPENMTTTTGAGCYTIATGAPARSFLASGQSLDKDTSGQWNFGGGMRVQLTDLMAMRFDLRDNLGNDSYTALMLTAGLSFRFGGEGPIDDDGDGVPTFRDACPDTPRGATVNVKGCPADTDGDKILDGLDKCPTTPVGWPVDDDGCPTDVDGDGVPDGRDMCPDTPLGAVVDHEGCPVDSDGDGVPDGLDECMTTVAGALVDEKGCALDGDGDGVPDGLDKCENTPAGLPVDADGCPIDSDGDGLKDDVDACPAFAGPGGVDDEGCPRMRLDKTARIAMPEVTFAFGSSVLTAAGKQELDALVASLKFYDDVTFEIEGHTDDVGSERDNFLISVERARAVQRYLRDQGIDPARMTVRGYGEIKPVADNTTEAGRARNRRIEILVTGTLEKEEPETGESAAGTAAAGGTDG